MGALIGIAAAGLKENPAGFIVKVGRFSYIMTATVIGLAWYSGWRNKRVDQGDYTNWPLPGVSKLPAKNPVARKDDPPPLAADFPASGGIVGGVSPVSPDPKSQGDLLFYDGKKVAAWIVPILKYARAHGWRGNVTSGYRSLADQTRIYNSGKRPAAKPGTSNHEFTQYPGGAVDVTNAAQLSNILLKSPYAKVLVWAGTKDPVHFSHPHDGGY